jgi:hypothetical protein
MDKEQNKAKQAERITAAQVEAKRQRMRQARLLYLRGW